MEPARPEFDLQPTLKGELIELRPLAPSDFDALFAAASDPLIWEQHPESDRYKPEVFQRYFDGAIESGGAFAIIDRKSGRIIGSSRYCCLKPAESEVEIGWTFLERRYWGGTFLALIDRGGPGYPPRRLPEPRSPSSPARQTEAAPAADHTALGEMPLGQRHDSDTLEGARGDSTSVDFPRSEQR